MARPSATSSPGRQREGALASGLAARTATSSIERISSASRSTPLSRQSPPAGTSRTCPPSGTIAAAISSSAGDTTVPGPIAVTQVSPPLRIATARRDWSSDAGEHDARELRGGEPPQRITRSGAAVAGPDDDGRVAGATRPIGSRARRAEVPPAGRVGGTAGAPDRPGSRAASRPGVPEVRRGVCGARRFAGRTSARIDREAEAGPEQSAQPPRERERRAAADAPTAATAARLDASSAPRFAGMNAEAKLATREKVSTASAPFGVIDVAAARRMTHASSAMQTYDEHRGGEQHEQAPGIAAQQLEHLAFDRRRRSGPRCRSTSDVPSAASMR